MAFQDISLVPCRSCLGRYSLYLPSMVFLPSLIAFYKFDYKCLNYINPDIYNAPSILSVILNLDILCVCVSQCVKHTFSSLKLMLVVVTKYNCNARDTGNPKKTAFIIGNYDFFLFSISDGTSL